MKALIATVLAATSVAAGTARAGGAPIVTAGTGCAVQCISKALVTSTATAAKVELATTAPADLAVTAAGKTVTVRASSPLKLAFFTGLEPDTTYAIVVRATDLQGRTQSRQGSFRTLKVQTTGHAPSLDVDSGLGCAAQCIEQAVFTQTKPAASIANIDIGTSVDAKVELLVSREYQIVSTQQSPGFVRTWHTQVGGLRPSTTYHVTVRATDTQGRTATREGSFRTVTATAVLTIQKLKIVNDGDKGRNKGELHFVYWANDEQIAESSGFKKLRSPTVIGPPVSGRPGVTTRVPVRDNGTFTLHIVATECDALQKKNCTVESGLAGDAIAGGTFDVWQILEGGGALPPWYGSGIGAPPGHDGYFVASTGNTWVRFFGLVTLDLEYEWPS